MPAHGANSGRWRLRSLVLALVVGLLLSFGLPLQAQAAPAGPETVRIGGFLTGLGDLDPAKKSFSASFWLWTVGPSEEGSTLDRLEFPNAIKVDSPNAVTEPTPQGGLGAAQDRRQLPPRLGSARLPV